jgi:hypothetical protein
MEYKRDTAREGLFKSAYSVTPEIYIKYEMNDDGTFKTFTIKFKDKGREWILEEIYNGNSNLTDYCTLTGIDRKFDKFIDAELKLVELIKNGNSS